MRWRKALSSPRFKKPKLHWKVTGNCNALRDEHARLSEQFQSKQFDGTLTQEDISKLRTTVRTGFRTIR